MSNKNWRDVLPQDFGACIPGVMMTVFGLLVANPVFLVIGSILILIPGAIVVVRRVAGG